MYLSVYVSLGTDRRSVGRCRCESHRGHAAAWARSCWALQSLRSRAVGNISDLYFIKHKSVACLVLLLMQLLPSFVLSMNFVYILEQSMYLFLAANSCAVLFPVCAYIPLSRSPSPACCLGQYHLICFLLSVLDTFYNRAF